MPFLDHSIDQSNRKSSTDSRVNGVRFPSTRRVACANGGKEMAGDIFED
jgi:hypothetical protein